MPNEIDELQKLIDFLVEETGQLAPAFFDRDEVKEEFSKTLWELLEKICDQQKQISYMRYLADSHIPVDPRVIKEAHSVTKFLTINEDSDE